VLQAIDLDPNFAEAYELLAFIYLGDDAQELGSEAAAKALTIDPDLAFAQALYQSADIENSSHLRDIQAFERAVREQPGNQWAMEVLVYDLIATGYLREALSIVERFVERNPLSLAANYVLAEALFANGRGSEAKAAMNLVDPLDSGGMNVWIFGFINLVEKQDDIAIAYFEAYLQQYDYPDSTWVRELVTGARDPATGQAYLDRRIPQIVASMPDIDEEYGWQQAMIRWYFYFGFLDRYFELILAADITDLTRTGAAGLVWQGMIFPQLGFTAHPKYLEVAELLGIIDVWEQRGPPDFCEKVGGRWVCE
jgi:hypothetical protein